MNINTWFRIIRLHLLYTISPKFTRTCYVHTTDFLKKTKACHVKFKGTSCMYDGHVQLEPSIPHINDLEALSFFSVRSKSGRIIFNQWGVNKKCFQVPISILSSSSRLCHGILSSSKWHLFSNGEIWVELYVWQQSLLSVYQKLLDVHKWLYFHWEWKNKRCKWVPYFHLFNNGVCKIHIV